MMRPEVRETGTACASAGQCGSTRARPLGAPFPPRRSPSLSVVCRQLGWTAAAPRRRFGLPRRVGSAPADRPPHRAARAWSARSLRVEASRTVAAGVDGGAHPRAAPPVHDPPESAPRPDRAAARPAASLSGAPTSALSSRGSLRHRNRGLTGQRRCAMAESVWSRGLHAGAPEPCPASSSAFCLASVASSTAYSASSIAAIA